MAGSAGFAGAGGVRAATSSTASKPCAPTRGRSTPQWCGVHCTCGGSCRAGWPFAPTASCLGPMSLWPPISRAALARARPRGRTGDRSNPGLGAGERGVSQRAAVHHEVARRPRCLGSLLSSELTRRRGTSSRPSRWRNSPPGWPSARRRSRGTARSRSLCVRILFIGLLPPMSRPPRSWGSDFSLFWAPPCLRAAVEALLPSAACGPVLSALQEGSGGRCGLTGGARSHAQLRPRTSTLEGPWPGRRSSPPKGVCKMPCGH